MSSSCIGSLIEDDEQNRLLKILIINELILLSVLFAQFCTHFKLWNCKSSLFGKQSSRIRA